MRSKMGANGDTTIKASRVAIVNLALIIVCMFHCAFFDLTQKTQKHARRGNFLVYRNIGIGLILVIAHATIGAI